MGRCLDRIHQPLLSPQAAQGSALASLTSVCFVGREAVPSLRTLEREVTDPSGTPVDRFDSVPLTLKGQGKVKCLSRVDTLSTSEPGDYTMTASAVNGAGTPNRSQVAYSVLASGAE